VEAGGEGYAVESILLGGAGVLPLIPVVKGEPPPPIFFRYSPVSVPFHLSSQSSPSCHRQCRGTPGCRESVPGAQNQGIDGKPSLCKDRSSGVAALGAGQVLGRCDRQMGSGFAWMVFESCLHCTPVGQVLFISLSLSFLFLPF